MKSLPALVSFAAAMAWLACAVACESRVDLGKNDLDKNDDTSDGAATASRDAAGDAQGAPSQASCEGACNKLFSCGAFPPTERADCMAACNAGSISAQRACIVETPCSQLVERCGVDGYQETDAGDDDSFAIADCRDVCDVGQFHDCLSAAEHSQCRERCATATPAARESFVACGQSTAADCPATQDCWQVFAE